MKILKAIWEWLLKIERFVLIVSCVAVVLLVFATVVMRYVLQIHFGGMEELVMLFAFIVYFIGGAYGSYEESQISADIVTIFMKSEKAKLVLKVIRGVIEAVLMGVAAYLALGMAQHSASIEQKTAVLKFPFMVIYSIIFAGLALMTMYGVYHTVRYARQLATGKGKEAAE